MESDDHRTDLSPKARNRWLLVLLAIGYLTGYVLADREAPIATGIQVALAFMAVAFALSAAPWMTFKLTGRPLTRRQYMITFTGAFMLLVLLALFGAASP